MSKKAWEKFKTGLPLTRKQAVGAQCYECNGYSVEKVHDCLGIKCPLYAWSPWGKKPVRRSVESHLSNLKGKTKLVGG